MLASKTKVFANINFSAFLLKNETLRVIHPLKLFFLLAHAWLVKPLPPKEHERVRE